MLLQEGLTPPPLPMGLLWAIWRTLMSVIVVVEAHSRHHRHQRHPIQVVFVPESPGPPDLDLYPHAPALNPRPPSVTFNWPPVSQQHLTTPRPLWPSSNRKNGYPVIDSSSAGVSHTSNARKRSKYKKKEKSLNEIQKVTVNEIRTKSPQSSSPAVIDGRGTGPFRYHQQGDQTDNSQTPTGTETAQIAPGKVYKNGISSRLVEVVTVRNLSPNSPGKVGGYQVVKTKNQKNSNDQTPYVRPKPLLDHFHGLHFGIMDPAQFPQRPPVKTSYSVEGTFLWAVGLFGTVENGAVLLTTIFSKKFKKPLHLLIGSLALTDLFVSLIYIPSYTYYLLEGDRMIQESEKQLQRGFTEAETFSFCKLSRSIFVEIASVTLTLKALIAVYLYISACSREWVSQVFSTKNTCIYIALAWFMNFFMLFVPRFLGYPEVDFYPNSFICTNEKHVQLHHGFSYGTSSAIYTFLTLAVHISELIVVCLCFIKIHLAIVQGKLYSDKHRSSDKQAKINYHRALKITCLVFASFCICWMPIYIINIIDPTHSTLPVDIHHLVMDLLLLKSSINPTIYIYGIRSLRYEIKLLCLCRCRKDNNKDIFAGHPAHTGSSAENNNSGTFSTLSGGV